jgi:formamidopyrimidine-DNA glycosylase
MPELPEVQTIIDNLKSAGIVGLSIHNTTVCWKNTIATSGPDRFQKDLQNKTIIGIQRRGKYIIFILSDGIYMVVHLRMTGRFELATATPGSKTHVHVMIHFNDGRHLMFHDTRKFGRFYITKTIESILGRLGPEPLSDRFTAKRLAQMLKGRKRQIKPLLLDQQFVAGLGNIYADEALWRSGIHPVRSAHGIPWGGIQALHRAIRLVLRQGLRNAGTSLGAGLGNYSGLQKSRGRNSRYLKVFRRTGQPCMKCGHTIERIVVGQRGTHICPNCQKI